MVNPGSFNKLRLKFLTEKYPFYVEAVLQGTGNDYIANVQRCFFKRFPIDLDENEDPTPEALAAVDDDAADPEVEEPDTSDMSVEEIIEVERVLEARAKKIVYRRGVSSAACKSNNIKLTPSYSRSSVGSPINTRKTIKTQVPRN